MLRRLSCSLVFNVFLVLAKFGVDAILLDQFIMGTVLCDLSFLHDYYLVCIPDC